MSTAAVLTVTSPLFSPSIVLNVTAPTPVSVETPTVRWWFAPVHAGMYPSPLASGKASLAGRHAAQRNYQPSTDARSDRLGARLPRTNVAHLRPQEDLVYTLEYLEGYEGRGRKRTVKPIGESDADICARLRARGSPDDLPRGRRCHLDAPSLPKALLTAAPPTTPVSTKSASTNNSPFQPPSLDSAEGQFWGFPLQRFPRRSSPDSSFEFQSCKGDTTPGSAHTGGSVAGLYCPSTDRSDESLQVDETSPLPNPHGTPLHFRSTDVQPQLKVSIIPFAPEISSHPMERDVRSPASGNSLGFVVNVPEAQRTSSRQRAILEGEFEAPPMVRETKPKWELKGKSRATEAKVVDQHIQARKDRQLDEQEGSTKWGRMRTEMIRKGMSKAEIEMYMWRAGLQD